MFETFSKKTRSPVFVSFFFAAISLGSAKKKTSPWIGPLVFSTGAFCPKNRPSTLCWNLWNRKTYPWHGNPILKQNKSVMGRAIPFARNRVRVGSKRLGLGLMKPANSGSLKVEWRKFPSGKPTARNQQSIITTSWKAKCPIFKVIVAGFRGRVA